MPSVCPVPASRSFDFVTWTAEGIIIGMISLRIGSSEVIQSAVLMKDGVRGQDYVWMNA